MSSRFPVWPAIRVLCDPVAGFSANELLGAMKNCGNKIDSFMDVLDSCVYDAMSKNCYYEYRRPVKYIFSNG